MIFLTLLVPKLPKVGGENDDYKKIIESVDLDSYRVVAQQTMSISLANEDAEVKPVPVQTDIGIPVSELDTLTHILESFHDVWGNCDWTDEEQNQETNPGNRRRGQEGRALPECNAILGYSERSR